MSGDFHDVIRGVGMGPGEIRDHHFVDAWRVSGRCLSAGRSGIDIRRLGLGWRRIRVESRAGRSWLNQFPEDRMPGLEVAFEP